MSWFLSISFPHKTGLESQNKNHPLHASFLPNKFAAERILAFEKLTASPRVEATVSRLDDLKSSPLPCFVLA